MKREELRALGMTPEQINKVMNLNGNDVNREKSRAKAGPRLQDTCSVLLSLLHEPASFQTVLLCITSCLREEAQKMTPGGAPASSTPPNDPGGGSRESAHLFHPEGV